MKISNPKNIYKGLVKEFRRIRWVDQKVLWPMTFVVIGFTLSFVFFFVSVDWIINWILKILKIIN